MITEDTTNKHGLTDAMSRQRGRHISISNIGKHLTLLIFVGRPYRTPLMSYRWMCLLSCGIAISPWDCDTDNLTSNNSTIYTCDCSLVSSVPSSKVAWRQLHTSLRSFPPPTSPFGQPSQTEYSAVSLQHIWHSGFLSRQSDSLELSAWLVARSGS